MATNGLVGGSGTYGTPYTVIISYYETKYVKNYFKNIGNDWERLVIVSYLGLSSTKCRQCVNNSITWLYFRQGV